MTDIEYAPWFIINFLTFFVTGVQDLQRELSEKVPAHQTSPIPHLLHQTIHKEQLLCREEPHHRQLPHHVCDHRCSG